MPVESCTVEDRSGFRWGKKGKCYTGVGAKGKAAKQGRAIKSTKNLKCRCSVHNQRTRIVPSNPLKADPTRSKTLRRVLEQAFRKRLNLLSRAVFDLVVTEDAFGLKQSKPFSFNQEQNNGHDGRDKGGEIRGESRQSDAGPDKNSRGGSCDSRDGDELRGKSNISERKPSTTTGSSLRDASPVEDRKTQGDTVVKNQRFAFQSSPQQVESFRKWLETQMQVNVLETTAENIDNAYWTKFVEDGYRKGQGRAFSDVKPAALASSDPQSLAFYEGTKQEFLRSSFGSLVAIDKVKLLAGRVFTEMTGVTQAIAQGITRELTEGLARGENPHTIARRMQDEIRGIGQRRATLIARTEITRAHAEGQLDAMERLGVKDVGVAVEWSTAGDDRVCPLCEPLEGVVMSLKEARGIIPRHPQCRCAFIPANVGEDKSGQKRSKSSIDKSLDKSIGRERPKYKYETVEGQFTPTGKPVRKRVGKSKETIPQSKKKSPWKGADTTVSKKRPKSILDD